MDNAPKNERHSNRYTTIPTIYKIYCPTPRSPHQGLTRVSPSKTRQFTSAYTALYTLVTIYYTDMLVLHTCVRPFTNR